MRDADMHVGVTSASTCPTTEAQLANCRTFCHAGYRLFYKIAYRLLGGAADGEDAVEDGLLAAYKHLDQFRGQSQMCTWLTTIVCHRARMQLRRRPRQIHVAWDERIGDKQEYSVLERLADSGRTPEDECRIDELNARVSNSCRAALAYFAKNISAARCGRSLNLENSSHSGDAERQRKGSVGTGTGKAPRCNAPRARTATSSKPHFAASPSMPRR
jgi:RNA polymerase sigma factor (sigma-70 family)